MNEQSPKEIIAATCAANGMTVESVMRRDANGWPIRTAAVSACRRACANALYATGRFSQSEVGRLLGMRSYASIAPTMRKALPYRPRPAQEFNGPTPATVDLEQMTSLLHLVSQNHQLMPSQMMQPTRKQEIVAAKSEFCWKARSELNATFLTIASFIGMHHSSVIYLVGRYEKFGGRKYDVDGDHATTKKAILASAREMPVIRERRVERKRGRNLNEWMEQCRQKAIESREVLAERREKQGLRSTGRNTFTLDEIGAYYGVSRETVSNWEEAAIKKLRKALLEDPYVAEWVRENT